jgi:hypothetical protein
MRSGCRRGNPHPSAASRAGPSSRAQCATQSRLRNSNYQRLRASQQIIDNNRFFPLAFGMADLDLESWTRLPKYDLDTQFLPRSVMNRKSSTAATA